MPNIAHVLVGCGGSGLKTLTRLTELLSQDYYWRQRMAKEVFYIVVDTDADDLQTFHRSVDTLLAGCPDRPYILPVELSQGVDLLQPLVHRYFTEPFAGGRNAKGRDRLHAHWWNRGPDALFVAPRVPDIKEGAGQCPPVSYFLMWQSLEGFGKNFDSLIQEIQRRQQGMPDAINFMIVGSLAGGTGRGSWELLAFKMRQLFFHNYGLYPSPIGFLFDASTFPDVFKEKRHLEVPMRVDALTGFSELSCWVSTKQQGQDQAKDVVFYRLPSMVNPESPEADVLVSENPLNVNNAAPIDHAYVVFGGSGKTSLEKSEQYFEMAGAAIYGLLSKSSIGSDRINSNKSYNGIATAMYEIDAPALCQYFEVKAYQGTVQMLRAAADVNDEAHRFFTQSGLSIDVLPDDRSTFRADANGTFLQKVLYRLAILYDNRFKGLEQALAEDAVDETRRLIKGLLQPNLEALRQAIRDVKAAMKIAPDALAKSLAEELFDRTKSVSAVKAFVAEIVSGMKHERDEMPADMPLGKEDPAVLVEQYCTRPLPLMRHFDQGEQKRLSEAARKAVGKVHYALLKKELDTEYSTWEQTISTLGGNADDLLDCLMRLERSYNNRITRMAEPGRDVFSTLFADPTRPELALPEKWTSRHFYRRTIKPSLDRGGDQQLLGDIIHVDKDLYVAVKTSLFSAEKVSTVDAYDVRHRMQAKLERAITTTVGLPYDFVPRHFSILGVIDGLLKAWRSRLSSQMRFEERAAMEQRFEEFFGYRPERRQEGNEVVYNFHEDDEVGAAGHMVLRMAASLARTCKPYWMLRDMDPRYTVSLFVPTTLDGATATNRIREYLDDANIDISVQSEKQSLDDIGENTANPFILLAYANQQADGLQQIKSLDYHTQSGVLDLIRMCEDSTGESIFHGGNNGGVGYVDPLYLRNEKVRANRWRPWADQEDTTVDALLYALFPGQAKGLADPLKTLVEQLENVGWAMPLIEDQGRQRYVFKRLPVLWSEKDARAKIDQQTQALRGWNVEKPVSPSPSLHNVYAVLKGADADSGRAEWRERILAESDAFWNTVLPALNCAKGTPHYRQVIEAYVAWLGPKSRQVSDDDPDRLIWEKLLARAQQISEV